MGLIKKIINKSKLIVVVSILAFAFFVNTTNAYATNTQDETTYDNTVTEGTDTANNVFGVQISPDDSTSMSGALQIVIVLTILALCPSILIMLTSFTRIIVVLHFTRAALSTQTSPPNQVLVGLALFLTFFIMAPVFNEINANAIQPLSNNEISAKEALEEGTKPIREFMIKQVRDEDLDAMAGIAGYTNISSTEEIPMTVLIPSFILSELRIAFWIGFLIYIPFIVIDMVVASTLMSMGMMMLPPTTISMPFKILLFVLADGWNLIIVNLMSTFVT